MLKNCLINWGQYTLLLKIFSQPNKDINTIDKKRQLLSISTFNSFYAELKNILYCGYRKINSLEKFNNETGSSELKSAIDFDNDTNFLNDISEFFSAKKGIIKKYNDNSVIFNYALKSIRVDQNIILILLFCSILFLAFQLILKYLYSTVINLLLNIIILTTLCVVLFVSNRIKTYYINKFLDRCREIEEGI
jgi:hypothetical protein